MNKAALCVVAGLLALIAGSGLAHDPGPIASATSAAAATQPQTLATNPNKPVRPTAEGGAVNHGDVQVFRWGP